VSFGHPNTDHDIDQKGVFCLPKSVFSKKRVVYWTGLTIY